MIVLAMDTSGKTAGAALVDENTVFAELSVNLANRMTHSEVIMPMVEMMFKMTGITLDDVDRIACTCGPGSFTGLRIGAACAKGLAYAAKKPLAAVPTLDAMAYAAGNLAVWVVPMLDARRGHVYSALYYKNKRMSDYLAEPVENVLEKLKLLTDENSQVIFFGDGAVTYKEHMKTIAPVSSNYLRAANVGSLALNMPAGDEKDFSLLYIRKPQAQREREERERCSK